MESAELTSATAAKRLHPEQRRREIVDAAKQLFRTDPEASLDAIAERASCTRQLVSHYFPGGGTGLIAAAILDDWIALTLKTFSEGMEMGSGGRASTREASEFVTTNYLNAAQELDQPWLFSDGRDRPGSGIGKRWSQAVDGLVEMLINGMRESERTSLARAAVRAELAGGNVLVVEMLEGRMSRDDVQRVVVEGIVACLETVVPRLVD